MLVLQGVALSALGRDLSRRLFPIMAMLFMLIPCGDVLQPLLRGLTVKWIEWFALAMDLPHHIDGFVAYVGDHRHVVIDPCSGLTFVTLAGFLGYSFGLLLFRSFAKVLALAALGAALGVLSNALHLISRRRGCGTLLTAELAAESGTGSVLAPTIRPKQ